MKNLKTNYIAPILILMLFAFLLPLEMSAQSTVKSTNEETELKDSIKQYYYNQGCWPLASYTFFSYDDNNQLTKKDIDGIYLEEYTYDSEGNNTSIVESNTASSTKTKDEFKYDANNNLSSQVSFIWNGSSWDTNTFNYIYKYKYNSKNLLTDYIYLRHNSISYANFGWRKYEYDNNNKLIALKRHYWTGENWFLNRENIFVYENNLLIADSIKHSTGDLDYTGYTYQDLGLVTSAISYQLNTSDNTWTETTKTSYTYNNENEIATKKEWSKSGDEWVLENLIEKTYIEENIYSEMNYQYSSFYDQIMRKSLTKYPQYINKKPVDIVTHKWNFTSWMPDTKQVIYYRGQTSQPETPECVENTTRTFNLKSVCISKVYEVANDFEVRVYPNPANDILNIQFSYTQSSTSYQVSIYGLDGKLVISEKIFHDSNDLININLSSLEPGVYFLNIIGNSQTYRSQLLVK